MIDAAHRPTLASRVRAHASRGLALLETPVDAASLGAFRIAYGLTMLIALARFAAMGWIDELYVRPAFHFAYPGFEWVHAWGGWGMYAHFAVLAVCALLITIGVLYRAAIVVFVLGLAYLELIDSAYYLNHYYALVLFGALLAVLPADRALALGPSGRPRAIPFAAIFVLRAQLGIIYFFAGIAKLGEDWLLRAEPMRTWLLARTDLPLVGDLFGDDWIAFAASWAGALFDLSIPFLLSMHRTRSPAYALVVVFHLATAALFRIGMFPWVMIALTPIFFAPGWPRALLRGSAGGTALSSSSPPPSLPRPAVVGLAAWLLVQVAFPLRHHLSPGDRLFDGEAMRWSWHVMVAERAGWAELRATDETGRSWTVDPSRELTPIQARMMAIEPDMLVQFARHVREDFARRGHQVRVEGDVWVAINGRAARRLVNPEVDLASDEPGDEDLRPIAPPTLGE
jgi:vitamin K-dependent gamma-carboxylase